MSKAFSSNELAFLSMLFFGVGLYGNLMWLGRVVWPHHRNGRDSSRTKMLFFTLSSSSAILVQIALQSGSHAMFTDTVIRLNSQVFSAHSLSALE